jgi:hypothetical protein
LIQWPPDLDPFAHQLLSRLLLLHTLPQHFRWTPGQADNRQKKDKGPKVGWQEIQ